MLKSSKNQIPLEFASSAHRTSAGAVDERPLAGVFNDDERQWLTDGADDRFEVIRGDDALIGSDERQWLTDGADDRFEVIRGDDALIGSDERQWLTDGADDRFEVIRGDGMMIGGDGHDTAFYQQPSTELHLAIGRDGQIWVHDAVLGKTDTLVGFETVQFADVSLDLSAASPRQMSDIGLLYQVLYDRAAGVSGIAKWAGQPLQGLELVKQFMSTSAFQDRLGALSDHDFVLALYRNTGFDVVDSASAQAWENYLSQHSRAELVGSWIADKALTAPLFGEYGLWLT